MHHRVDVVILTALPLESEAVLSLLEDSVTISGPQGSSYVKGTLRFDDPVVIVAVVESGVGNSNAALALERALGLFSTVRRTSLRAWLLSVTESRSWEWC